MNTFAAPLDPPRADASASRWPRIVLVATILLVHVIVAWRLRVWGITSGDDDAGYVLLARALGQGHYRELHDAALLVGAKYPPGYPALLAIMGVVSGENLTAYLLVGLGSSVLALWLFYDAVRRLWGDAMAMTALAVAAVSPFIVLNAGKLMSEAPFMAWLMLMLWATVRRPQTAALTVVAAAAAIMGGLTRSAGITLVPALGLYWLIQRRFRAVVLFGVASAMTVGAWTAWILMAPSSKERDLYVADAVAFVGKGPSMPVALARRTAKNIREYTTQFVPNRLSVPTVAGTAVDNVIVVVLLAVFIGFGSIAVWRRWRLVMLFLSVYSLLLVLWAFAIDRFVEPVLPLLILLVLLGAQGVAGRFSARAGTMAALAVAAVLGIRSIVTDGQVLAAAAQCDRANPLESPGCVTQDEIAFFQAARFAAQATEPNALVLTAKPRPFYYYSGRRTINQNVIISRPPSETVDRVRSSGARYVLISELGFWPREFRQYITASCAAFVAVREFPPRSVLLRLRDVNEPATDSLACAILQRQAAAKRPSTTSGGLPSAPPSTR